MDEYLIQIRLGPVQTFIQQARKTRDFWSGSQFLSSLSREVAKVLLEYAHNDVENLIVPAPEDPSELDKATFPIPNVLIAIIYEDPNIVAAACKAQIDLMLKQMWQETLKHVNLQHNQELAWQQVAQMVDFDWGAIKRTGQAYIEERNQLDEILKSIKQTKQFTANTFPVSTLGKKSSIDGRYEAVYTKTENNEHLSGIDLLKRFGYNKSNKNKKDDKNTHNFPSTSHMAAQSFRNRVQGAEANFRKYLEPEVQRDNWIAEDLQPKPFFGCYDGSIFFEERLVENIRNTKEAKELKGALQHFIKAYTDGVRPSPYYAILQADGDHMGNAIRATESPKEHRNLADRLQKFAMGVREIVEDHTGALVYAGGDDILALVPVDTVLACANKLREEFATRMKDVPTKDGSPTLTVGIAIVHHLEPLTDALELARSTEKRGKTKRNSLAIAVNKRGGALRTIQGSWQAQATDLPSLYKRLETFVEYHVNDELPDGYAYEISDLLTRMSEELVQDPSYAPILQLEAQRILAKKNTPAGNEVSPAIVAAITKLIEHEDYSLHQLATELIIARTFAEVQLIGHGTKEPV